MVVKKIMFAISGFCLVLLVACGHEGDIPQVSQTLNSNLMFTTEHLTIEVISEDVLDEFIAGIDQVQRFAVDLRLAGMFASETVNLLVTVNELMRSIVIDLEMHGLYAVTLMNGASGFIPRTQLALTRFPVDMIVGVEYRFSPFEYHYIQYFAVNPNGYLEQHGRTAIAPIGEWPAYFRIDVISDEGLAELYNYRTVDFATVSNNVGGSNLLFTFFQPVYHFSISDTEIRHFDYGDGGAYIALEPLFTLDALTVEQSLVVTNFPLIQLSSVEFSVSASDPYDRRGFTFEHPTPDVVRLVWVEHGVIMNGMYGTHVIDDNDDDYDHGYDDSDNYDEPNLEEFPPIPEQESTLILAGVRQPPLDEVTDYCMLLDLEFTHLFDYHTVWFLRPMAEMNRAMLPPADTLLITSTQLVTDFAIVSLAVSETDAQINFSIIDKFTITDELLPGEWLGICNYMSFGSIARSGLTFVNELGIRVFYLIIQDYYDGIIEYWLVPFIPTAEQEEELN